MDRSLMWFRDDLRVADNPALQSLAGTEVIALYVVESGSGIRPLGAASAWWLRRSLIALATELARHDVPLHVRFGDPRSVVPAFAAEQRTTTAAWSRRYHQLDIDSDIKTRLDAHSYPGFLLTEPWEVRTTTGSPYKVYTPYARRARDHIDYELIDAPSLTGPGADVDRTLTELKDFGLVDWASGFEEIWQPGEAGAWQRLEGFVDRADGYADNRDFPAVPATSNLSPHLRFGEISPGRCWHMVNDETFRSQLLWRDFAWHRLYHRPDLATVNVRKEFDAFPWYWDPAEGVDKRFNTTNPDLADWRRGTTGFELVDAGMRELWATGTMHNRVRMVVGSFLTKNLRVHWRHGEEWFWDTLVDADAAANAFNWQWVAGCGDDAAPYFRIFNPETQATKFDPDGTYRARWAKPALKIVDLNESRAEALAAYEATRR